MSKSRPSATHAPMAGRASTHHKSCCNSKPGLDCADYTVPARYQRKLEKRQWRRELLVG